MRDIVCRTTAYIGGGYLLLTIIYLALAQTTVGAPLRDSLTPEQRLIRRASAADRARIALVALIVTVVVLAVWQPF